MEDSQEQPQLSSPDAGARSLQQAMISETSSQPHHLASSSDNNDTHSDSPPPLITTMFGALNRFIARLDAAPEEQQSATQGAFGFQVLKNTNADVPLEPWFDFIIGINGRSIVSLQIFEWNKSVSGANGG
jgi:hypothetical protein